MVLPNGWLPFFWLSPKTRLQLGVSRLPHSFAVVCGFFSFGLAFCPKTQDWASVLAFAFGKFRRRHAEVLTEDGAEVGQV